MFIYFYIVVSALIQSITEFLPVSSSGHLVIWHYLVASQVDSVEFDIFLHAGSVLALVVYFWNDLIDLVFSWARSFKKNKTPQSNLAWSIIIATIPAAVLGFFAEDIIVGVFRSPIWVIAMLILIGLVFIWVEKKIISDKDLSEITFKKSLIIGLAQCLSFIPGTSRSGVTIVTAMMYKIRRAEAARYSFLLAIPILLGATFKGLITMANHGTSVANMTILTMGLFISFVFSLLVIKFFLNFLRKHSLTTFAYYRIALAIILVIILYLTKV